MNYSLTLSNCLAAALTGGIWLVSSSDFLSLVVVMSAALTVGCLAVWAVYRQNTYAYIAIVVLFFFVGCARGLEQAQLSPYTLKHYIGQTVMVQGTICEAPRIYDDQNGQTVVRYVIESQMVTLSDGTTAPASGRLIVSSRSDGSANAAWVDDVIMANGQVQALHGFNNPGRIDSVAALERSGIVARMTVRSGQLQIALVVHRSWAAGIAEVRQEILLAMRRAMPPEPAAMLFGILFGGYDGIATETVAAFSATGIVHILSVSGTHVALIAAVVYWLCSLLRLKGKWAAVLVTAAIIGYSTLAGFSPPVARSAAMGIAAVGALALGREQDACQALAMTTIFMLFIQPLLLFDIGFQLSFGATAGLVYLFPKFKRYFSWLPVPIGDSLALTLAAQLSVLPFLAWYFHAVSISSLAANLIVVPLVEFVMILGLVGVAGQFVWPLAGQWLLAACAFFIEVVSDLTKLLAAVPGGIAYVQGFSIWISVAYYLLLWWLFSYTPQRFAAVGRLVKRWLWQSVCIVVLGLTLTVHNVYFRPFSLHFIDVGQGDATLVITPGGRTVLIDTGGSASGFDIGERVVVPYLRHYGIDRLDYLILTHGHQDHAGGAAAVARHMDIDHILAAREPYSPAMRQLYQHKGQAVLIPAYQGQTIVLDDVVLEVVYAADALGDHQGNEASNVIRIVYGQYSFLITGDLEQPGEAEIVQAGQTIASTVLKAGHHGSKTSTSQPFLQLVAPRYAVVSAGATNRFGHPHAETLQRLRDADVQVYRTDRNGAIVFWTNGQQLSVEYFIQ